MRWMWKPIVFLLGLFVGEVQIWNILIVRKYGWVGVGRVVVKRRMAKRGREGEGQHLVMGVQ